MMQSYQSSSSSCGVLLCIASIVCDAPVSSTGHLDVSVGVHTMALPTATPLKPVSTSSCRSRPRCAPELLLKPSAAPELIDENRSFVCGDTDAEKRRIDAGEVRLYFSKR